jgi:signal transduction histidine kinase
MGSWARVLRVVDPLVAAALLAAGQYALWALPVEESGFAGAPWLNAVFLTAVCVPLAWRARSPLTVYSVVLAGTWLWLLLLYGEQPQPPFIPAVALWLSTFSAASVPGRRTAAAVGVALVAFLLSTDVPALLEGRPWGNVLPSWVLFGATFLVGRVVALRQEQIATADQRASRAEAERAMEAARAVTTERTRIARELHDVVTHAVSVIVVQAAAEARAHPAGSTVRQVLDQVESTGREALVELRGMLGVLRHPEDPAERRPQPSLREVETLLAAARATGVDVRLDVGGVPVDLPATVDLTAYRIVQEALTNVRKHGAGGVCRLRIDYGPGALVIEVVNPAPVPDLQHVGGHGLVGLRERVELNGGVLETALGSDGCYWLRACLPYQRVAG